MNEKSILEDKSRILNRIKQDKIKIAGIREQLKGIEVQSEKPAISKPKPQITKLSTKPYSKPNIRALPKKDVTKSIIIHKEKLDLVKKEVSNIIVGQSNAIDTLLRAILANGHVLLEGVPGIAKTLMVRAIAEVMQCKFGRIQFTPDLLPLELIGLTAYSEEKGFYTIKGPIFNHFILADEINRAPAKVQSALLEAMQEKQATIGNNTFPMLRPFFTFATQNPIESWGTNNLPEAQLDRFLFKILIDYPTLEEEQKILKQNISMYEFKEFKLKKVLTPLEIIKLQEDVKEIYLDNKLEQYIIRIVDATRRPHKYNLDLSKYIQMGSSPRASISLFIASKAEAALRGMSFVTPHHIRKVIPDVLRHRILINYEGKSENITPEDVISEILKKVPIP